MLPHACDRKQKNKRKFGWNKYVLVRVVTKSCVENQGSLEMRVDGDPWSLKISDSGGHTHRGYDHSSKTRPGLGVNHPPPLPGKLAPHHFFIVRTCHLGNLKLALSPGKPSWPAANFPGETRKQRRKCDVVMWRREVQPSRDGKIYMKIWLDVEKGENAEKKSRERWEERRMRGMWSGLDSG